MFVCLTLKYSLTIGPIRFTFQGSSLLRQDSSLISGDHQEKPEHHTLVVRCDALTPKDIRLRNIQQTINPLIARPLSGSPNCAW